MIVAWQEGSAYATASDFGDMLIQPQLANTFRRLAAGGADAWYRGEIAKEIAAHMEDIGGLITTDDLAAYSPRYADTLRVFSSGIAAKLCIDFVRLLMKQMLVGVGVGVG